LTKRKPEDADREREREDSGVGRNGVSQGHNNEKRKKN